MAHPSSLGPRLRGGDELVIPAKAGIQFHLIQPFSL
jgi:hypothetical protein